MAEPVRAGAPVAAVVAGGPGARQVGARLRVKVLEPARLAFQVAVAGSGERSQRLTLTRDGAPAEWRELLAPHGGRVWLLDSPPGVVELDYAATVAGAGGLASSAAERSTPVADDDNDNDNDQLRYLRPSRYCESDRLLGFARRTFGGIRGADELLAAVSSWVGGTLEYVVGSSGPTDGAVDALLAGRGVCRDFAHLVVALLRALEVPSRLVAVYAPGLTPMDFHAVAEAYVDGAWRVVDATLLAPRSSLVRIAAGRDAADISFLSSYHGAIELDRLEVVAVADDGLPSEDVTDLVSLG